MNTKYINIILAVALLFLIYKAFTKFGILKSSDEIKGDKISNLSAFSPLYYKKSGGTLLKHAAAKQYAEQLYEAKGFLHDSDEQAISVFRNLKSKSQVSQIADVFNLLYKKDLATYLNFMDDDNRAKVYDLVKRLK